MHRQRTSLTLTLFALPLVLPTALALGDDPVFFSWTITTDHYLLDPNCTTSAPLFPTSGTSAHYTYCPQPGGSHDWGLGGDRYCIMQDTWNDMATNGLPIALLMRTRNSPWGSPPDWTLCTEHYPSQYTPSPEQLALGVVDRFNANGQINYVLADLEPSPPGIDYDVIDTWMANIGRIVRGEDSVGVTGNPDQTSTVNVPQSVIQAWDTVYIGNYNTHRMPVINLAAAPYNLTSQQLNDRGLTQTARTNITAVWSNQSQTGVSELHDIFVDNDLNTIMPVTYAYSAYIRHVDPSARGGGSDHWSNLHTSNVRSAYLWASIERYSAPVRVEIAASGSYQDFRDDEFKVIPWVCPFVSGGLDPRTPAPGQNNSYQGCWMPPSADFLATIKHLRLRGADGFYFWGTESLLDPGGQADSGHWSVTDSSNNYLNPWYTATEDWADAGASLNGHDWFEAHALISWEELDGDFDDDAVPYRFDTDKESDIVVSAMNDMGRLSILISYMRSIPVGLGTSLSIDNYFPAARDYSSGSAVSTVTISQGYSHLYELDFFTPDVDGDGDADTNDQGSWFSLYINADQRADWNRDGSVDSADLTLYNAAYADFNS